MARAYPASAGSHAPWFARPVVRTPRGSYAPRGSHAPWDGPGIPKIAPFRYGTPRSGQAKRARPKAAPSARPPTHPEERVDQYRSHPGDILSAGLIALPGVYRPQADTRLLAEALTREDFGSRRDVLEIGTGTGALALHAAGRGARVTAVDVAWPAVVTARLNALRQRVSPAGPARRLRGPHRGAPLRPGRGESAVRPRPRDPAPAHGPERAWDAGPDGRDVIDRICARAPALLRPGGVLLMVHSGMCGAEETVDRLAGARLIAKVTARASVPWGPVLRSRRAWLERQGLAAAAEEREELVVIRAQYP
ncbi:hypothetical protein GCM10020254_08000 [Streptomyces goshikiensis]